MPNPLGDELRKVRDLRGRSLKSVADAAGISVAYLVKLEKGEVTSPSPHVLHKVAGALNVSYTDLMRLAGYVIPDDAGGPHRGLIENALSSEELTEEEARALATYLKVYRTSRD